jgi:hypothetical protein
MLFYFPQLVLWVLDLSILEFIRIDYQRVAVSQGTRLHFKRPKNRDSVKSEQDVDVTWQYGRVNFLCNPVTKRRDESGIPCSVLASPAISSIREATYARIRCPST